MAARMKYPAAHEQLFVLAVRARREGRSFEAFWGAAIRPGRSPITVGTPDPPEDAVRWPRDSTDRNVSIRASVAARDGWRRAYEGMEPTGPERALILLAPLLSAIEDADREGVPVAA
jgi:hypothetical protein